jgi:hypothetical protein
MAAEVAANRSASDTEPRRIGDGKKRNVDGSRRKRSAVTNGTRAFIEGDGNSPWYRRVKDLATAHVFDLGGAECLSQAQISLCRRAAVLECELERIEGQLSLGAEADLDAYNRISGGLRRILETIGLKRAQRDVTQTLEAIAFDLASRRAVRTQAPDEPAERHDPPISDCAKATWRKAPQRRPRRASSDKVRCD